MAPASLGRCWANVPSVLGGETQCHSRVNPKCDLGLCGPCKRRLSDDDHVNEPVRRANNDQPNTQRARRWAQEAGLL